MPRLPLSRPLWVLLSACILSSPSVAAGQFNPPRIRHVVIPANVGNQADSVLDQRLYYIDKGLETSITQGSVLNVYRERRLFPGMEPPLRLFIGNLTITTAQPGSSIGRFTPSLSAMAQPTIKYKVPVLNDLAVPRLILDSGVLFDAGAADLKPGVEEEFVKVADFVRNFSPGKVIIEGHTDSDGPEDLNQNLSELRAENVRLYLINRFDFISPAMIESKGYGESSPMVDNDTPENKTLNRRIEVVVWE